MALKDQDFLLKKDKELDKLLSDLGVEVEAKPEFKDELADKYELDLSALEEMSQKDDQ